MSFLPPPPEIVRDTDRTGDFIAAPEAYPRRRHSRPLLLIAVFALCLAGSQAYVWLREPLYRTAATLLTVAPPAPDQPEAAATPQHAAVERQTLLGVPLLQETLRRLQENPPPGTVPLSLNDLRGLLSAEPVAETNVIELRAEGPRPDTLAAVVNAWIDAYQSLRERSVSASRDSTADALREEIAQLGSQIESKRRELDNYRREHDILSRTDLENKAPARLSGLNKAINEASDAEVKAKARLDAVRGAIARGQPVVPPGDQQSLANLEKREQELQERVDELERRFTPQYIALQPQLKVIPEQLRQLREQIRRKLELGQSTALSEAEQAYASARQSVQDTRHQMDAHKREATEFTAAFTAQEALQASLTRLEEVHREKEARLAQLDANPIEHYPQLQVISRAVAPDTPVWPDYRRDSAFAAGGSLAAALLAVLLFDFLTRRERSPAPVQLPDIRIYSVPENLMLQRQGEPPAQALQRERAPGLLESPLPRELTDYEIRLLLDHADLRARQLAGLLLSGLSPAEAATLSAAQIDLAGQRCRLEGIRPREVPLAPSLAGWLAATGGQPDWAGDEIPHPEELDALIGCAAVDAGVPEPDGIDAGALRHTYIAYLVRHGIRLSDLEKVVGPLPAKTLAAYRRFSPPGPGLRAEAVPLIHPVQQHAPPELH